MQSGQRFSGCEAGDGAIEDELVILLTPHIVSGDRSIEQEVREKIIGAFDRGEGKTLSEFIVE